jgi:hypothetical protein
VSHVPAGNKNAIILSSQHHEDISMGEEKDQKLQIILHYKATKSGFDLLDKFVRSQQAVGL